VRYIAELDEFIVVDVTQMNHSYRERFIHVVS